MAPTLTLTFGEPYEASAPYRGYTLDLAGAGTTGYFLQSEGSSFGYAPAEAQADISYAASPYIDGNRPVSHRFGNTSETINVEIVGSSVDDALLKLRNLQMALRRARDYFADPNWRDPAYISFKPSGATNLVHSVLYGGSVQVSSEFNDAPMVSFRIMCKVTLEREPFWRAYVPTVASTYSGATDLYPVNYTGYPANIWNAKPWGELAFDAGVTRANIGGDIAALARLMFTIDQAAGLTLDKLVVAYRSAHRHPNKASDTTFQGGVVEAEGGTNGTDTTSTVDATASPGSGSSKKTCTFATAPATSAVRFTVVPSGFVTGQFRIFARVKLTAAGTTALKLKYYSKRGPEAGIPSVPYETTEVAFTSTSWTMVDMGIVDWSRYASSIGVAGYARSDDAIEFWASRSSGAASLDIDFLCFMPVDECYLTITGAGITRENMMIYASTIEPAGVTHPLALVGYQENYPLPNLSSKSAIGTGALYLPAGAGKLFWLSGNSSWQNTFSSTNNHILQLHAVERYLNARGA